VPVWSRPLEWATAQCCPPCAGVRYTLSGTVGRAPAAVFFVRCGWEGEKSGARVARAGSAGGAGRLGDRVRASLAGERLLLLQIDLYKLDEEGRPPVSFLCVTFMCHKCSVGQWGATHRTDRRFHHCFAVRRGSNGTQGQACYGAFLYFGHAAGRTVCPNHDLAQPHPLSMHQNRR